MYAIKHLLEVAGGIVRVRDKALVCCAVGLGLLDVIDVIEETVHLHTCIFRAISARLLYTAVRLHDKKTQARIHDSFRMHGSTLVGALW
jgi:hypothetical protein